MWQWAIKQRIVIADFIHLGEVMSMPFIIVLLMLFVSDLYALENCFQQSLDILNVRKMPLPPRPSNALTNTESTGKNQCNGFQNEYEYGGSKRTLQSETVNR